MENDELELFQFIESTMKEYEMNLPSYQYTEGMLKSLFLDMMKDKTESVVAVNSRIKKSESLKEKLIRNKFYLHYKNAEEAIANLSDLIGITIECRFIRDEDTIYRSLAEHFAKDVDSAFVPCSENPNVFLNMRMTQPQLLRNGFTNYRIDGYYLFNGRKINFELQIKALVHAFWSEVEHEIVYKNPNFVSYDSFLKDILGSIRDNLDVVDRQLEIVYSEISEKTNTRQIGMDERGFKVFVASSINDIVNEKMKKSVGFTTDFKKCSSILAQYIYVKDFVSGENNQLKMIEYFERLNLLSVSDLDFKAPIRFEDKYVSRDPFCSILGDYWQKVVNTDYEWHVFFVMLLAIQPGNNTQDLSEFIQIIETLLIQPGWYSGLFSGYGKADAEKARDFFKGVLASALVSVGRIEIVHEDRLLDVMDIFHRRVTVAEEMCPDYKSFEANQTLFEADLRHQVTMVFH